MTTKILLPRKGRCGVSKYTESFGKWFNPFDEKMGQASKVEAIQYTFEHQQSKINELLERLGKYEKKAQRDDKKICDMGIELFQVNERLRECEKSLKVYADTELIECAREYFKKYEGKDD